MKKRVLALITAMAMTTLLLAACNNGGAGDAPAGAGDTGGASAGTEEAPGGNEGTGSGGKYTFIFLPNTQNNTFQSTMNDTYKRLCGEAGYEYVCLDPDYDLNTQLNQLADAATRKPDAVFVIPVDSQGIRQGLQALNDAGIPVFNVDTQVVDEDRELVVTFVGTDAYHAGTLVGQQMAKDYPDGGNIAILDFPENESCVNRVAGFMDGLGENAGKFNIVATQNGAAALDVSMPLAEDIIQANPNLDAFFCINDPSALGAAAAIKSTGKTGIGVYSIDASPEGKAAMVDGSFSAVAAQVPIQIAEESFQMAVSYLEGGSVEAEVLLPSFLVTADIAEKTINDWQ